MKKVDRTDRDKEKDKQNGKTRRAGTSYRETKREGQSVVVCVIKREKVGGRESKRQKESKICWYRM